MGGGGGVWLPQSHHSPDESDANVRLHASYTGFYILAGRPVPWKHLGA